MIIASNVFTKCMYDVYIIQFEIATLPLLALHLYPLYMDTGSIQTNKFFTGIGMNAIEAAGEIAT